MNRTFLRSVLGTVLVSCIALPSLAQMGGTQETAPVPPHATPQDSTPNVMPPPVKKPVHKKKKPAHASTPKPVPLSSTGEETHATPQGVHATPQTSDPAR